MRLWHVGTICEKGEGGNTKNHRHGDAQAREKRRSARAFDDPTARAGYRLDGLYPYALRRVQRGFSMRRAASYLAWSKPKPKMPRLSARRRSCVCSSSWQPESSW